MLTALIDLGSIEIGRAVVIGLMLLGWLSGAGMALCFGILPLLARHKALVMVAARLSEERDDARAQLADAKKQVVALHRDAHMKAQMYVHGLQLARRVDQHTYNQDLAAARRRPGAA